MCAAVDEDTSDPTSSNFASLASLVWPVERSKTNSMKLGVLTINL